MSMFPNLCFENKHKSQSNRWRKTTIGGLGKFIGGGTPDTANPSYWNGFFPWVSSQDIAEGSIEQPHITKHISEEALRSSATQIVPKDAVMIVTRVGVGKVSIAPRNICTSQDFTNLVLTDANPVFVAHLLLSKKPEIMAMAQGTSIKGISLGDLKDIEVHLPDLSEQQKIADALSAMDEKISSLRENEGALVRFKVGLMQKLFSQELRFQQDDGEDFPDWEEVRIGDFCKSQSGGTPSRTITAYYNGDVQWASITDMTVCGKYIDTTKESITAEGVRNSSARIFPKNTVLLAMYASVGKVAIAEQAMATSQAILGIQPNSAVCNHEFLYYALCAMHNTFITLGQGGVQSNLNKGLIENQSIAVPTLAEQVKIVNALATMDEKIDAVDKEIALMETFKKGLLQQMFV